MRWATLVHEHVLVDFVGADRVSQARYTAIGHLPKRCRTSSGSTTVVPNAGRVHASYLGRDPVLLAAGSASKLPSSLTLATTARPMTNSCRRMRSGECRSTGGAMDS